MSIICTNKDELESFMKHNLKESRYIHSLGVEKMAALLAEIHGADVEKARFAGRYHDIAKGFDVKRADEYVVKYGIDKKYLGNTALSHSKIAAEILKNEYDVQDEEILNAIRSHTTGRVGMSLLEEIVYVADAIEENRNYPELKRLQELAKNDLDQACKFIMDFAVEMILAKGRELDTDTLDARDFIIERLGNNDGF